MSLKALAVVMTLAASLAAAVAFQSCGDEESAASSVIEPTAIGVAGSPRGIAIGEGATWVTRFDDGKVTRITASGTESIDVGRHPDQIVAGEGSVWVSVDDGKELVRIDPQTHQVAKRVIVDFGQCNKCRTGDLELVRDALWIGSPNSDEIFRLELSTNEQFPYPYEPGPGFEGVFTTGDDFLWALGNDTFEGKPLSWVIRINPISAAVRRIHFRSGSFLDGIAYGAGKIWVADAGNGVNAVTDLTRETEIIESDIDLGTRITSGDIAFAAGSVFVWDPVEGQLTRIDAEEMQIEETQQIRGYKTGQRINREWSDLAVQGKVAWVTDPAADAVYEIEY